MMEFLEYKPYLPQSALVYSCGSTWYLTQTSSGAKSLTAIPLYRIQNQYNLEYKIYWGYA